MKKTLMTALKPTVLEKTFLHVGKVRTKSVWNFSQSQSIEFQISGTQLKIYQFITLTVQETAKWNIDRRYAAGGFGINKSEFQITSKSTCLRFFCYT